MHAELQYAAESLGVALPALERAAVWTERSVDSIGRVVRDYLHEELGDRSVEGTGLYLVAFGSMARQEMGPESDFDYLVVAQSLTADPSHIRTYREAAEKGRRSIAADKPGLTGLFGTVVAEPDLVTRIGLDEDTNAQQTRRVLLLEESIPLSEPNSYRNLIRALINRYLLDYEPGEPVSIVPRFLVNDIVRYWRTVAVDYQAKRWWEIKGEDFKGEKWGLRYIKLRSTRKLTFAASFASVLLPYLRGLPTTAELLHEQFEMPPLPRLAQYHRYLQGDALQALGAVLELADWFNDRLSQDDFRSEVSSVSRPDLPDNPTAFLEAQEKTRTLQRELERLFFSNEPLAGGCREDCTLGDLTMKYLSF